MTKLVYPSNGIYTSCRNCVESCSTNLLSAKYYSRFSIPSGFSYASYLRNLGDEIFKLYRASNNIQDKLRKIDYNFDFLETELSLVNNQLIVKRVKKRSRMIID